MPDAAAVAAILNASQADPSVHSRRWSASGTDTPEPSERQTAELAVLEEHFWPSGPAGHFSVRPATLRTAMPCWRSHHPRSSVQPFVFDVYVDVSSGHRFPDAGTLTHDLLEAVIANLPAEVPATIRWQMAHHRSDKEVALITLPLVAEHGQGLNWTYACLLTKVRSADA